jgi:hypothetical protein
MLNSVSTIKDFTTECASGWLFYLKSALSATTLMFQYSAQDKEVGIKFGK